MKKRLISLALTLVMLLGLLPTAAFAVYEDFFASAPVTAETNSNTGWVADGDSLRSNIAGKSYAGSTLTVTVSAEAQIRFEYKVSSEAKYDVLTISHNGTAIVTASGEQDWTGCLIDAQSGDTLEFVYKKDGSGNSGSDCAWIRNFSAGEPIPVTLHANNGTDETLVQNFYGPGTLKPNGFAKDHGVFAGWSDTAEGEVLYADGAALAPEGAMDLYAVWEDAYEVRFADTESFVNVKQGDALGAENVPVPSRTGYLFQGWFNGGAALDPEAPVTEDVTYTAAWSPISYTVSFNANGGQGTRDSITLSYDQAVKLPENIFVRAGYNFIGWGTSAGATTPSFADQEEVSNLCDTDGAEYRLYAVWSGKQVPLTVDLNYDAEERTSTRTCVVGYNYNYIYNESTGKAVFSSLPDPVRTGYLFQGWFSEPEGGTEITNQYKFADDSPMTIYAHWTKAVTVTFDPNGGSCYTKTKQIPAGSSYGTLPTATLSGKYFEGWFTAPEGGSQVDRDTVFESDITLYAHFRNYQYIIKFSANGGEGSMESMTCEYGVDYTLPVCAFKRDGYVFKGWNTSTYSSTVTYQDGAVINRAAGYYTTDGSTYTLYAVWEQTVFGKAFDAIAAKLPDGGIVRGTGSLGLPLVGAGYTVAYACSDGAYIDEEGNVLALPESGAKTVTLTATVTDTGNGDAQARDYELTLYSQELLEKETYLKQAVDSLSSNFQPVYGVDTNANRAVEAILEQKGYEGITVSLKEAAASSNGYASIDADGTIHYYFNPSMTGSGGYFYADFVLSYEGLTVEKNWYTALPWDEGRVRQTLENELAKVTLPTEPITELSLPMYPPKDGENPAEDGYTYYNQNTWAKITWVSENEEAIEISAPVAYPYYQPYSVTVTRAERDQTVTLRASIVCNNVAGVVVEKEYTVTVKGTVDDPYLALREELQAKLDKGLDSPGLTDFVTGEPLDTGYVVNDIQLPTTRDFGVDGKYQPVTIASSNEDVIQSPGVNNAARVWVYRPLPGEKSVKVILTVAITDKETGVSVSREIPVTVQPLTQEEIDAELALMEQVKAHYFDGIKNTNTDPRNITADLRPFQEAYLGDGGELVWVYVYSETTGRGIVPVSMDGWEAAEQWRLFKSSNAQVISHENLLVTRQAEHKNVTVTSWLSSETLGKYAEKYPDNQQLQKLYQQPVTAELTVTGTAPSTETPEDGLISVSFTLSDNGSTWISRHVTGLPEGCTVYDVFTQVLAESGYTPLGGSYITGITKPDGSTLSERDRGPNSGWMYAVNGVIPAAMMTQTYLQDGDSISFFYTDDYTKLDGTAAVTPEEVIRLIEAIGTVTEDSGGKIQAARAAYDSLSAGDRAKVTNYNKLVQAEKDYAALIKGAGAEALDIYKTTGDFIEAMDGEKLCVFGSEWLILGLARSGREVPQAYLKAVEDYVSENADENGRLSDRATDNARLILALTAAGEDVTDIAGKNLLLGLSDMARIQAQKLSGAVYALLAFDSLDYEIPEAPGGAESCTREALLAYILQEQLKDGGWAYSGETSEPDMTAMALQALAPYYEEDEDVKKAVDRGVARLSAMQTATGGYAVGGVETSESAAQVIVALTALGIDPHTDSRFVKNGVSVLSSLCSFYVDGGGFRHVSGAARDDLATAQGYYALAAYYRFLEEETSLYDMTDLLQADNGAKAA